jgi:hypothetical protein
MVSGPRPSSTGRACSPRGNCGESRDAPAIGCARALLLRLPQLQRGGDRIEELGRTVPFDLDLCALLPAAPVRRGESWRVPVAAVELLEGMDLGTGDLEVVCTFLGTSRGSDGALARIELSLEHEHRTDDPARARMKQAAEGPTPEEFLETTTIHLRGELLWNPRRAHAERFTVTAELAIETYSLARASFGGRERTAEAANTLAMHLRTTEIIAATAR